MASPRHPGWALTALIAAIAVPLAVAYPARSSHVAPANGVTQGRASYATSNRCQACHPQQYASWHRGYHRTMTQYASPASVKGDFENQHLVGGNYDVNLTHRGDQFFVEMVDPLWQYQVDFGQLQRDPNRAPPRITRPISLVTGSHHMQAYWIASDIDNAQLSMPFTYLFDDHRWVPRGDVFLHPEENGRHQIQVWNVSCIRCHATAGQPLANVQPLASKVGEMGIACEQCHGPAEAHIAANQNPLRRYFSHLGGGADPTITNPARLVGLRANQVCGQCHSLTDVTPDIETGGGKVYKPGDDLYASQPLLSPLHPSPNLAAKLADDPLYLKGYFWRDGTIRVSSRDFSALVESKCATAGNATCMSCHSLHEADPDGLVQTDGCASCHAAVVAEGAKHTHHAAGSAGAQCTNCHMPYTVYGLLKGIRNHRIDAPHVTADAGGDVRPNACNLCHADKTLAWTAAKLTAWYGQPAPAGLVDTGVPASVEWMLSGDAILRAIAAWNAGHWGQAAVLPYVTALLGDSYAAVRYVAGHAVKALDPRAPAFDYLLPPVAHPAADPKVQATIDQLQQKRDDTPVRAME